MIADLLNYDNPRKEEFEALIKRTKFSGLPNTSSEWIFSYMQEGIFDCHFDFLKERIEGNILIDLGCGQPWGAVHIVEGAKNLGASEYVGVDLYNIENREIMKEKEFKGMPLAWVKDDMLRFVSKLRSNSANFIISNIDYYIIESEEYISALKQEVARATKPRGIVFGSNNSDPVYLSGYEGMSSVVLCDEDGRELRSKITISEKK